MSSKQFKESLVEYHIRNSFPFEKLKEEIDSAKNGKNQIMLYNNFDTLTYLEKVTILAPLLSEIHQDVLVEIEAGSDKINI